MFALLSPAAGVFCLSVWQKYIFSCENHIFIICNLWCKLCLFSHYLNERENIRPWLEAGAHYSPALQISTGSSVTIVTSAQPSAHPDYGPAAARTYASKESTLNLSFCYMQCSVQFLGSVNNQLHINIRVNQSENTKNPTGDLVARV